MRLTEAFNLAADKIANMGFVAIERAKAAGTCAHYSDPAYPGKIIREHPDGSRDVIIDKEHGIYAPIPPRKR